jgi:hypothetical protein
MHALMMRAPWLRAQAMRPCWLGTGTRLRAPRIASPTLQHLDMRGCTDAVAPHAWLALLRACPALRTLRGFPEALLHLLPAAAGAAWVAAVALDGAYADLLLRAEA